MLGRAIVCAYLVLLAANPLLEQPILLTMFEAGSAASERTVQYVRRHLPHNMVFDLVVPRSRSWRTMLSLTPTLSALSTSWLRPATARSWQDGSPRASTCTSTTSAATSSTRC